MHISISKKPLLGAFTHTSTAIPAQNQDYILVYFTSFKHFTFKNNPPHPKKEAL